MIHTLATSHSGHTRAFSTRRDMQVSPVLPLFPQYPLRAPEYLSTNNVGTQRKVHGATRSQKAEEKVQKLR